MRAWKGKLFWKVALGLTLVIGSGGNVAAEDETFKLFEAQLPALRALHPDQYDTPEKIQLAWNLFLQNAALGQTARLKGYADSPEMRLRITQMLAQELILKEVETARPMHAISDAEIRAHFETNKENYRVPAMLGAHEIVLTYDPKDTSQRHQQMVRATDILKSLSTKTVALPVFEELIKAHSDPQSVRANAGNLGIFPAQAYRGQIPRVPESAVTALLELKEVGRLTEVLDDGSALRIMRLSAFRAALPVEMDSVKEGIRRQLYLKARAQKIDALSRMSGWDPTARLTAEQVNLLMRPALKNSQLKQDLPPSPEGVGIPDPGPPRL